MTITEGRGTERRETYPDREAAIDGIIASLAADPVAMLPVRIETRFVQLADVDPLQLKLRFFPEQLNVHAHVEGISPEERQAGIEYWRNRIEIGTSIAWKELLKRMAAPRASWVAKSMLPENLSSVEGNSSDGSQLIFPDPKSNEAPWVEPPVAVALPRNWIVAGYRDGERVLLEMGNDIPTELKLGPAPDVAADDEPATQDRPPDEQSDLPIEEGMAEMAWLTDYDRAVEVGMALTVTDTDVPGGLHEGFDRLLVLGIPQGSPATMAELLEAHRHTDGLAFLRQGTATNNTAAVPSGFHSAGSELANSLDPANPEPALDPETGAGRLAAAIGTGHKLLADTAGGALTEDGNAGAMNGLLWETTWGYFLDHYMDPIVDDAGAAAMRSHFVDYVRGRGPLPAIRVGEQPYGVLPVMSGQHFRPEDEVDNRLHQLLGLMTGLWGHGSERSPFLAKSLSTDADLLDVLESTPHSVSLRARAVVGPTVAANSDGMTRFAAAGEAMNNWLTEMLFAGQRVRGSSFTMRAEARRLRMPFASAGELSETEPLDPDYLFRLAVMLRRGGAFSSVQAFVEPTVLAVLARQSAQLVFGKAAAGLVIRHRFGQVPPKIAPPELEFRSLAAIGPNSLADYAMNPYQPISGSATMADYLASLPIGDLAADPITAPLAEFIETLDEVRQLPSAELDRLTAETLDLCSHRLDAWHTSMATKRLGEIRSLEADKLYVGGFGWLQDVRTELEPDSLGYVHAPSIAQATTAAILRSGYLAHKSDGDDRFAIDLSSHRVRLALDIMDGVRSGLSLAAMMGYRFERGLRERDIELAQYILDFRKLVPLVRSVGPNQTQPLESMAARDVVDGVKLVELAERLSDELLFSGNGGVLVSDLDHRNGIRSVLADIRRQLDAVADVLVAEGVHQAVHGNVERAAAAADAIDRQGPPPDPEVVRTPRTSVGVAHRLLVSLSDSAVSAGWPTSPDPRAAAEPRLNAWVSRLLGDPRQTRFAAEVADLSIEDEALQVVEVVEVSLDALALSPLSVVWAGVEGGAGQITELDERIARALAAQVTHPGQQLELRIMESDQALPTWPPGTLGLAGLHALIAPIHQVVSSGRPSRPDDLVDPNSDDDGTVDAAEHLARADAAEATLQAALTEVDRVIAARIGDVAVITDALTAAAAFGVGGVLPDSPEGFDRQLGDAQRVLRRRRDDAAAASDASAKLAAVFGNGFVSLTLFDPPEPDELSDSLSDRDSLLGGDPLAATTWLQQSAMVRPGAAGLAKVLANAEAIGAGTGSVALDVVQLPHAQDDRWLALPLVGGRLPAGNIAMVVHTPAGFDPGVAQAGLVIDEWNEALPNPVETTGVSFHYDAPGTRAPQTVLLAVPGDRTATNWSLDELLNVLDETLTMTMARTIDPQRLWMVNTALPAIYMSANSRGEATSVNIYQAEALYRATTEGVSE